MFAFGLGCLFLFLPAARRPLLVTGLAGAVLLTAVVVHNPTVSKRLVEHTAHDLTNFWDRRIGELWLRGVGVWQDAPLFGVGLKNFRNICERQDFLPRGRVEDRCYTHPHQLWNEWLAETGIVGLSGFIVLIGLWSRPLVQKLRRRDEDYALTLGVTIALIIFLWPLRSSMSFFTNWIGAMFWLLLGLALALATTMRGRPIPPS
jgi:O-antigen ligase